MSIPKVSVCVPAYNQPELLERCLFSVADQKYKDYEVIVTDDSTNDDVRKVVLGFAEKFKLKYQKNPSPLGSPENWNAAIAMAAGEYIKIMHHDDWFSSEESLGEFVKVLDENPASSFVFSASNACTASGQTSFIHSPTQKQLNVLKESPNHLFSGNFIGAPSAVIYRRNKNFQYDKNLKWLVDIDFYISYLFANRNFIYINKPLVCVAIEGGHKVTNVSANNKCVELREHFYLYQKIKTDSHNNLLFLREFWSLLKRHNINSKDDLSTCNILARFPEQVVIFLAIRKFLYNPLRKIGMGSTKLLKRFINVGANSKHISYAQSGEDLIVGFVFEWLGIKKPTYIDLGAHHPTYISNTYYFYRKGSSGVCVEPNPKLFSVIKNKRSRDTCLNIGVGTTHVKSSDFYIMSADTLSTFSRTDAELLEKRDGQKIVNVLKVPLVPVNEIIDRHMGKSPNFVSLDIEGLDLDILKTFDFKRFRPEVFCVETLTYTSNNSEQKIPEIIDFMKGQNYFVYADTYINTIFVDKGAWERRSHA